MTTPITEKNRPKKVKNNINESIAMLLTDQTYSEVSDSSRQECSEATQQCLCTLRKKQLERVSDEIQRQVRDFIDVIQEMGRNERN